MSPSPLACVRSVPSPPPRCENRMDPVANRKQFTPNCIRTKHHTPPTLAKSAACSCHRGSITEVNTKGTNSTTSQSVLQKYTEQPCTVPRTRTPTNSSLRQRLQHPATTVLLCPSSRILHRSQQKRRQPDHNQKFLSHVTLSLGMHFSVPSTPTRFQNQVDPVPYHEQLPASRPPTNNSQCQHWPRVRPARIIADPSPHSRQKRHKKRRRNASAPNTALASSRDLANFSAQFTYASG